MKRLTLIIILIAIVAFPITNADAKNSSPQMETLVVSHENRKAEKTAISLGECPVWAQVLVGLVVGLFALMAVVPLLIKRSDCGG